MTTKYRTMSNDEFLGTIDDNVAYSPVLIELVRRLHEYMDAATPEAGQVECPCCEANLEIVVDSDGGVVDARAVER